MEEAVQLMKLFPTEHMCGLPQILPIQLAEWNNNG